jgi:hypothetical protein
MHLSSAQGLGFDATTTFKLDSESNTQVMRILTSIDLKNASKAGAIAALGMLSFYGGITLMNNLSKAPDFSTKNYFGRLTINNNQLKNDTLGQSNLKDIDPLLYHRFYWGLGGSLSCMLLGVYFVLKCSDIAARF